jgi:hypothetical protein
MSPSPRLPHSLRRHGRAREGAPARTLLRLLVLLVVAMLAAGPHPEALATPPATVSSETSAAEHDVLDSVLHPSARQGHRLLAAPRVRAVTGTGPEPSRGPVAAPPPYSPLPRLLRCVVLRC